VPEGSDKAKIKVRVTMNLHGLTSVEGATLVEETPVEDAPAAASADGGEAGAEGAAEAGAAAASSDAGDGASGWGARGEGSGQRPWGARRLPPGLSAAAPSHCSLLTVPAPAIRPTPSLPQTVPRRWTRTRRRPPRRRPRRSR
jgi:hypothetical protein